MNTAHNGNCPEVTWSGASSGARAYLWYTRRVPDHWAKLRVARHLGRYFFPRGLPLINQTGARIQIDISEPDFIPHALVYVGSWEPRSLALATELMKPGGVFLDIGSHLGLYTCTVGRLDGVSCVCIEPSAEAFIDLQKNLSLNPQIQARLVHAGVSSEATIHSFGNASAHIDEVLGRIKPQPPIRLLKIDVEGHELEVFKGLDWSGPFRPENIISEFNPSLLLRANHSPAEFLEFFEENDYEALTITGEPFPKGLLPPEENVWLRSRESWAAPGTQKVATA